MHSADYAVARCLSVCHAPAFCLNGYTYHSKFFSPSGSPETLVFYTKRDGNIPTGTRLTGVSNARRYEKITIFDQYLALSQRLLQDSKYTMSYRIVSYCKMSPFFDHSLDGSSDSVNGDLQFLWG